MKVRVRETNWAKFEFVEDSIGRITESHIGYGKGCIWTEPELVGFSDVIGTIDEVAQAYEDFYGKKEGETNE